MFIRSDGTLADSEERRMDRGSAGVPAKELTAVWRACGRNAAAGGTRSECGCAHRRRRAGRALRTVPCQPLGLDLQMQTGVLDTWVSGKGLKYCVYSTL